jgi:hypothetical protein
MPLHLYECSNGHRIQINESASKDSSGRLCTGRGTTPCGQPIASVPTQIVPEESEYGQT